MPQSVLIGVSGVTDVVGTGKSGCSSVVCKPRAQLVTPLHHV